MSLLPIDLNEVIEEELTRQRRDPDGLLHASSHLVAPLRHVQLDLAGAPQKPRPVIDEIVLMTGTMWHEWIANTLRKLGLPYMAEVNITPWLPKGWGGTADIVMWNPDYEAFVLVDVKTTKGESLRWRIERGASEEHRWQTSVYWHALRKMGLPMSKRIGVLYLPKNATRKKDEVIEPTMIEFDPIPARQLGKEMTRRRKRVEEYRKTVPTDADELDFLTDKLEAVPERVQRVYYDRSTGGHVLKLTPHWTAQFCPFPDELCNCRDGGTTTVGLFDEAGDFHPRSGYEDIEPEVFPED